MTGEEDVVVADGAGEEVAGVLWVGELDDGLCAAEVGTGLAAQKLTFGNEVTGEVARNLEESDGTFGHIASDAYADA